MTLARAVRARLLRRWIDLRSVITLRRHEKRWTTYALRLLCLGLLAALPVKKLVQLGPLDGALALVKAAVGAALVVGALAAVFAVEEALRRRRRRPA